MLSTTVEVRGWLEPRDDAEAASWLFHTAKRVLGFDEARAHALAQQFRDQGTVVIEAQSREIAERLSDQLQGKGALIYLAPSPCALTCAEIHPAAWGTRRDDTSYCRRLTPSSFRVDFSAPTVDEITGLPAPRPSTTENFSLAGIPASRARILEEDEDCLVFEVELVQPLPSVAFVPDPKLSRKRAVALETAMRIVGGHVISNWIFEDQDYWYFYFFSFGPNCHRVAKADGTCTRMRRGRPR